MRQPCALRTPLPIGQAGRLAALLAAACLTTVLGSAPAHAQPAESGTAVDAASRPAFEIDIRAPEALRELLATHLELRRYREVSDLDESELARLLVLAERDARQLLGTQGYFTPQLQIRVERSVQPPRVLIELEPGPPALVGEVDLRFSGDIATSADPEAAAQREAIRGDWELPAGQRFTQEAWDAAKSQAVRQLVARRYPRGRIAESLADIDAATQRVGLGLRLDSGPLFRLGPTTVTGLERYDPRLVPRLVRLPEGTVYDQDRIVQAQLRLTGSGYFDSAFLYVDPESDPQAAPLQVNVRETPLQRLVLGLGLTTDRGPRLSAEYRHNRVPGIGWRADTRLQLERDSPSAETEWTAIPDADGWRWGVFARTDRQRDEDGQDTRTQRLRLGRSEAGDRIDRNVYLQYERAVVRDATGALAPEDTGDGSALTGNYIWTRRALDNVSRPTRGHALGFELGAGITLGTSRLPFQRSVLRGKLLWPLTVGRLQLRGEAGAVLAQPEARVPATQLFRTGGDTSVRGYGFRDIGVERVGGIVSPGRYLTVGSVEWQRPIRRDGLPSDWEQALFVDVGAVADSPAGLEPRVGAGTGVRYISPIGPLQADLAYGFKTHKLRLHLTVGVTF